MTSLTRSVDGTQMLPAGARFSSPHLMKLGSDLVLRLYADTRPHNLELARLQKGLVLTLDGQELIEEGVGFGVPIMVFSDKTYFSGSAEVSVVEKARGNTIVKRFFMDTVSKKGLKDGVYVDNPLYKLLLGSLASAYRNYPSSRKVVLPLIKMRNRVGIRTLFTKTEPRGEVSVTYSIKSNSVNISANFSILSERQCRKMLLLNEQGAAFFRRFIDSEDLDLIDDKIGAWDPVEAKWGYFSNLDNNLGFYARRLPDSKLFRGREQISGRLSWAGMGYELSPKIKSFNYTIDIVHKHV